MKRFGINVLFISFLFIITSCGAGAKKAPDKKDTKVSVPSFNADSAYVYVEKQTLFGPRVPNTKEHELCRAYLTSKMKLFGAKVIEQTANLEAYDGSILKSTNIIASFQTENPNRILLCAHWDSRPWADNDPDKNNWHKPIIGANDGASGVGVLMEIARQLGRETAKKTNLSKVGIDIIFFDAEDEGTPKFSTIPENDDSWCLGTQYWAKNPHTVGYKAKYGVLLDMVGGKAATFQWEYFSRNYAQQILQQVWEKAASLGYDGYFKSNQGGAITDDHVYINKLAKIPCIDIIDFDPDSKSGFVPYWHTLDDTMKNIDKSTLKAVGETLIQMIYSE
jgi:hypothetical protein